MAPPTREAVPSRGRMRPAVILGIIVLVWLVVRICLFLGVHVIDHVLAAQYAHQIAHGAYSPVPNHHALRLTFLLPMALFQACLGLNDLSCSLFPMLCSLGFLLLVFRVALRWGGLRAATTASLVTALLPLDILHSTQPNVDVCTAFFSAAAGFIVVDRTRNSDDSWRPLFLSGVLAGIAYLMKESGAFILMLPVLCAVARRQWRLGVFPVAGFLLALGAEMILWGAWTGDPLYRWSTNLNTHTPIWHIYYPAPDSVTQRLTYQIPAMMLLPAARLKSDLEFLYFLLFFWLAGGAFVLLRRDSMALLLGTWAASTFAAILYFPSTLNPYYPALIAYARHLYPLVAPCALAIGLAVQRLQRPRWATATIGLHLALCLPVAWGISHYQSMRHQGVREAIAAAWAAKPERIYVDKTLSSLIPYVLGFPEGLDIQRHEYTDPADFKPGVLIDHPDWREGDGLTANWEGHEPADWTVLWEGTFPKRPTMGQFLRGTDPGTYRLRVIRVGPVPK